MIKYTCKSVEETETKYAHHFPPYHIGNRLGVARFHGGYLLYLPMRLDLPKKYPLPFGRGYFCLSGGKENADKSSRDEHHRGEYRLRGGDQQHPAHLRAVCHRQNGPALPAEKNQQHLCGGGCPAGCDQRHGGQAGQNTRREH